MLRSHVLKGWMCTTGMLAAEATFKTLVEGSSMELYWENLKKSWIWEELYRARNYRPVCDYVCYRLPEHLFCLIKYSVIQAFEVRICSFCFFLSEAIEQTDLFIFCYRHLNMDLFQALPCLHWNGEAQLIC